MMSHQYTISSMFKNTFFVLWYIIQIIKKVSELIMSMYIDDADAICHFIHIMPLTNRNNSYNNQDYSYFVYITSSTMEYLHLISVTFLIQCKALGFYSEYKMRLNIGTKMVFLDPTTEHHVIAVRCNLTCIIVNP